MTGVDVAAVGMTFFASFLYANAGLGGGLLHFPIVVLCYPSLPPSTAVAIGLLNSLITLGGSAVEFARARLVRAWSAVAIAVPMVAGALLGAQLTLQSSAPVVKVLFGAVLLALAVHMWRGRSARGGARVRVSRPRQVAAGLIAFVAGLVSGSFGIGGGILGGAALMLVEDMPAREAVATIAVALIPTAAAGLASLASRIGSWPLGTMGMLAVAAVIGSMVGSRYGLKKLRESHVRRIFVAATAAAAVATACAGARDIFTGHALAEEVHSR